MNGNTPNRAQRRAVVRGPQVSGPTDRLRSSVKESPGVVVAYPHPVGEVSARFHTSLIDLLVVDSNGGRRKDGTLVGGYGHITRHGGHMPMSSGANIVTARNKIVRAFLDNFPSKPEWLWFVDADMTFEPDILERLLEVADAKERPIVGGLCFALMKGEAQEIVPTVYGFNSETAPKMIRYNGYPVDQVVQVAGTGAACLLVHRSVFETIRDRTWTADDEARFLETSGVPSGRPVGALVYPPPWPYFQETVTGANWGDSLSEDLTFCLRAGQCGFPIWINTSAKTGHVKPVVIDEAMYWKELPGDEESAPTYVAIPVKGQHHFTHAILAQLHEQGGYEKIFIFDNGSDVDPFTTDLPKVEVIPAAGQGIYRMWNDGIRQSLAMASRCNVAILNNDLILGEDFLNQLAAGLRAHPSLLTVSGNYDKREFPEKVQGVKGIAAGREDGTGGWAGFGFMLRGECFTAGLPLFDEQYQLWYGDNDFLLMVEKVGGTYGIVRDAHMQHIGGGSNTSGDGKSRLATAEYAARAEKDRLIFETKWKDGRGV